MPQKVFMSRMSTIHSPHGGNRGFALLARRRQRHVILSDHGAQIFEKIRPHLTVLHHLFQLLYRMMKLSPLRKPDRNVNEKWMSWAASES